MRAERRRANLLDGRTWTRHSISVWSDLHKSREERQLKHPALFPEELPRRVIECFLPPEGRVVLDPFCGLGATVLAAHSLGRVGVGLDVNPDYIQAARGRLGECADGCRLVCADAADLLEVVEPESVDLAVTSPPYWNVLLRRRSADRKAVRNYGDRPDDLGRIADYGTFLDALGAIFDQVLEALRPGAYCVVVVMDIRQRNRFYPLHADLARRLCAPGTSASGGQGRGFLLDDIIIWDRRHEYNNFRPLGYPSVFRINKAHEYLLIFQKPK